METWAALRNNKLHAPGVPGERGRLRRTRVVGICLNYKTFSKVTGKRSIAVWKKDVNFLLPEKIENHDENSPQNQTVGGGTLGEDGTENPSIK